LGSTLFSMRAPNYSPTPGQFLSNDPLGVAAGDINVRRFVGNSPVSRSDPSGLVSQFFGISGGLGLSLTGGLTINDNGDVYETSGIGGTSGGVSVYSASTANASEGDSIDYSGTIGGTFGGVTA